MVPRTLLPLIVALLLGCGDDGSWFADDDDSGGDDDAVGDDDSAISDDDDDTTGDDDDTTPPGDDDDTTGDDDDTTGDDDDTTGDDDDTVAGPVEPLASAHAKLVGEAADDHAGSAIDSAGDVNGDGLDDILVGAEQESSMALYAGAAYVIYTPVGATFDLSAADAKLTGEQTDDRAGASVAGVGDMDGDNLSDIAVGAYRNSSEGEDAGAVYVMYGPVMGDASLADADAKIAGEAEGDWAGSALAGVGDVDGDGFGDLAVGAYRESSGGTWAGAVYLVYGAPSGEVSLADADAKFTGEADTDQAGAAVAGAGDINGDGIDDLVVGAMGADGGNAYGAAYVIYGPVFGTQSLASADAKITGEAVADYAGGAVSVVGDMNGDGRDEVLVGAKFEDSAAGNAGAAYLLHGSVWSTVDLGAADAKLTGEAPDSYAGSGVAGVGDVDGDGLGDLVVGASGDSSQGVISGAAYLITGAVAGTSSLAGATLKLVGEADNDWAGWTVAHAGDCDADGLGDFLISAPREDAGGLDAGAVYVYYGAGL